MQVPCVLVVEDEKPAALLLQTYLASLGVEILVAEDADQALAILATRKVQAVVSDYRMPGKSGLELANIIKQQYPDTPVFILSGSPQPPESRKAPIEGWFTKGEPLSLLRKALLERLGKRPPQNSPNTPSNASDLCTCGHARAYHSEQGCEVIKRFGIASGKKCPCSGFVLAKIVLNGNAH
jgi:CheY-like chemotaxis protein